MKKAAWIMTIGCPALFCANLVMNYSPLANTSFETLTSGSSTVAMAALLPSNIAFTDDISETGGDDIGGIHMEDFQESASWMQQASMDNLKGELAKAAVAVETARVPAALDNDGPETEIQ